MPTTPAYLQNMSGDKFLDAAVKHMNWRPPHLAASKPERDYKRWTAHEESLLRGGLPVPGRSKTSCVARAKRLGIIPTRGRWTDIEDGMLMIGVFPPNRSLMACQTRRFVLRTRGIHVPTLTAKEFRTQRGEENAE